VRSCLIITEGNAYPPTFKARLLTCNAQSGTLHERLTFRRDLHGVIIGILVAPK
jgi:hypothetical protein